MPTTKEYISRLADIVRHVAAKDADLHHLDIWTIVYRTKGGTVIVASSGTGNDNGQPRDLMAVLPMDLGQGRVIPLYIGTNPDVVRELSAELERRTE